MSIDVGQRKTVNDRNCEKTQQLKMNAEMWEAPYCYTNYCVNMVAMHMHNGSEILSYSQIKPVCRYWKILAIGMYPIDDATVK